MNVAQVPAFSGAALRERRKLAGLTREQLAHRSGLSMNAINALESGRRKTPSSSTAAQLAHALGCKLDDLFRAAS